MSKGAGRWRRLAVALATATVALPVLGVGQADAALTCLNDTGGANDVAGQRDLTQFCADNANFPISLSVTWNWDELSVSGKNTLDACSLFDTDLDGNANSALCLTVASNGLATTTLYTCGDGRPDRCSNPLSVAPSFASTCSTSIQSTDPFPAGAGFPLDRVASCDVQLADVGAGAVLINACSYASQRPKSGPADCVVSSKP